MKKLAIALVFVGMVLGLTGHGAEATFRGSAVAGETISIGTFPTTTTTTLDPPTTTTTLVQPDPATTTSTSLVEPVPPLPTTTLLPASVALTSTAVTITTTTGVPIP
jgi:hypothetical protein